MKKALLIALGSWFACAGLAPAQGVSSAPIPMPTRAPASLLAAPEAAPATNYWSGDHDNDCPRVWFKSEYLLWRIKDAPMPVPIATTAELSALVVGQNPGAIGSTGTTVISPNSFDSGLFSGTRATAGLWLDDDRTIGVEASGFLLESRTDSFIAGGTRADTFLLSVPFLSALTNPASEAAVQASIPGLADGSIVALHSSRLWGAEANGLLKVLNNDRFTLTALAGLRYMDLSESLDMAFSADALPLLAVTRQDNFSTRNQFYGGQVGARAEAKFGALFASVTGKVALGNVHQTVSASGTATVNNPLGLPLGVPAGVSQFQSGFFTQPSNIGRRTRDSFGVLPEVGVQVGVDLGRSLRVFGGYDFLYLSNAVRPGDQIDRQINLTQQFGGTLIGPAVPQPQHNRTDFWTHGLNAGLLLKF